MTITMRIKTGYNCVEVWLNGNEHSSLFLDLYNNGEQFCDSGNIKRASKLYPNATKTCCVF